MRREKCFKEIGFEKDTVLSYFNKHNMAMKMHMLLTSNPFAFFTLSMARVNQRPTSASTQMDGALMEFAFSSLC